MCIYVHNVYIYIYEEHTQKTSQSKKSSSTIWQMINFSRVFCPLQFVAEKGADAGGAGQR